MRIKKYVLVGILEQCKERGLTTVDSIIEDLKPYKDTDVVVTTITENENKDLLEKGLKNSFDIDLDLVEEDGR